jgi:hypothetical protein
MLFGGLQANTCIQLEELVFDFVGFASKFLSSLVPCLSAMVTRSGQKF